MHTTEGKQYMRASIALSNGHEKIEAVVVVRYGSFHPTFRIGEVCIGETRCIR